MASSERGAESRPLRVTFFEDRAEVVRRATLSVPAGKSWQTIEGVTPFVDDRSLRAAPRGAGVTLLGARVLRRLDALPPPPEEAAAAQDALREAERRLGAAEQGQERCRAQLSRVERLSGAWAAGVTRAPQGIGADDAGWREALAALVADAKGALEAEAGAYALRLKLEDERQAAEQRLEIASASRSRWEAAVQVQLEVERAGEVEVELTYRTPCALWRPEHLVRLERESDESPEGELVVTTFATAWQATGEDWRGVEAAFSTARPGRAAQAPNVSDDLLRTREKSAQEQREVVVAARDEAVQVAGLGRGQRASDDMPGVDDGGEPLTLRASEPVDLPSTGQPFRVETGARTLRAGLVRVCLPEVSPVAHLRATATLSGELPLLAGPVRLSRGEGGREQLVGRSKLDFVAAGEPFELGFGPDDAIRVRREERNERDSTLFTGTQHLQRSLRIDLSNLSTDVKRVLVQERYPISEIDAVEVKVVAEGWERDEEHGFLSRVVELPPRGEQTLAWSFSLKAGSKVRLPF